MTEHTGTAATATGEFSAGQTDTSAASTTTGTAATGDTVTDCAAAVGEASRTSGAARGDVAAMRRALELARLPAHRVSPNPRVGAVLVSPQGVVIAEGHHRGPGTPHAEIDALRGAGAAARGATAVVTLEPCHHTGRTDPCTRALVDAGIARVVYAVDDPNPVASGGAQALRAAGVDVVAGLLADEAAQVNEHWLTAVRRARPWVTWKYAATLDGRSAATDGTSRWITSGQGRLDVQRGRARADAIVVGTGTVLVDDPWLVARYDDDVPLPVERQPLRVVVGRREIPDSARVWDDAAPTVQIRTRDVTAVLASLWADDVVEVWLEGGPCLAGAFVAAGLVDEVVAYLAPALLGDGRPALGPAGTASMSDIHRFDVTDVRRVGSDIRVVMRPLPTTVAVPTSENLVGAVPSRAGSAGAVPTGDTPTGDTQTGADQASGDPTPRHRSTSMSAPPGPVVEVR